MGSEEVLDEVATADNLEALLRRCAENLPGDYKPDSQTWGGAAVAQLMDRIRGTPLEADANQIFERFLDSGTQEEVLLAENSLNPALISVEALEAALARTELPAEVQRQVRSGLGRALAAQPAKFQVRHRVLLSQPGGDALVGAAIVGDHSWFLAHVKDVLGADSDAACNRLWFGLQALHGAEAKALRAELDARRAALGDAYAQALVETIDGEDANTQARGGSVRWPPVALAP